jgi:hypothetical protein
MVIGMLGYVVIANGLPASVWDRIQSVSAEPKIRGWAW